MTADCPTGDASGGALWRGPGRSTGLLRSPERPVNRPFSITADRMLHFGLFDVRRLSVWSRLSAPGRESAYVRDHAPTHSRLLPTLCFPLRRRGGGRERPAGRDRARPVTPDRRVDLCQGARLSGAGRGVRPAVVSVAAHTTERRSRPGMAPHRLGRGTG